MFQVQLNKLVVFCYITVLLMKFKKGNKTGGTRIVWNCGCEAAGALLLGRLIILARAISPFRTGTGQISKRPLRVIEVSSEHEYFSVVGC